MGIYGCACCQGNWLTGAVVMTPPSWSGDSPASAERRRQNALRREQQIRERARESDWVTVAEFCRITSRSRSTVDRWRKR